MRHAGRAAARLAWQAEAVRAPAASSQRWSARERAVMAGGAAPEGWEAQLAREADSWPELAADPANIQFGRAKRRSRH